MRHLTFAAVTYNLCRLSDREAIEADLRLEMSDPNVRIIFTQESRHFLGVIARLCSRSNGEWAALIADDPDAAQNVILYRTNTLRLKHDHWFDVPDSTHFDRWVTIGSFEFVDDPELELTAIGTHFNPHIEKRAWWWLPRFRDAKRHIGWVAYRAGRVPRHRAVLVAFDGNVDLKKRIVNAVRFFPTKALGAVGLVSNWKALGFAPRGTHGNRYIDAIFFRLKSWFKPIAHSTADGESDHRRVRVVFRVTLG